MRAAMYDPFTDPWTGNKGVFAEEPVVISSPRSSGLVLADIRGKERDDTLLEAFINNIYLYEDAR